MVRGGMTVGSLFSGVEGFGLGFEQAGFDVAWQVEREPFCIAVLKTHFPNVERYYDILRCGHERIHKLKPVDVITAGFPCQDLSVAGKRAGLAGNRSGLFWEAIRIVGELCPSWFVLENVPGLFSSNDGRDFAMLLSALGELRLFQSIAWTVLDSQYFGVAQRRRRVFIVCGPRVGSSEQVLFERESGEGDFAPSRETRPELARDVAASLRGLGGIDGGKRGANYDAENGLAVAFGFSAGQSAKAGSLGLRAEQSPTLRGASSGTNQIPCAYLEHQERSSQQFNPAGEMDGAMRGDADDSAPTDSNGVRDFAGLPEGMDSARYRALGNAVTASVARWIAERIKAVMEA